VASLAALAGHRTPKDFGFVKTEKARFHLQTTNFSVGKKAPHGVWMHFRPEFYGASGGAR
jgi:hypothetical protein